MDTITFDEFLKVDMRVGTVTHAEAVPKSKKLLKLTISFGSDIGVRTILAGIAEFYQPDNLIQRKVVAIVNLAPRAMMGVESHGMLLAGHGHDGTVCLLPATGIEEGQRLG